MCHASESGKYSEKYVRDDIKASNISLDETIMFLSSYFNKNFDLITEYVLEFKILNERVNIVCKRNRDKVCGVFTEVLIGCNHFYQ